MHARGLGGTHQMLCLHPSLWRVCVQSEIRPKLAYVRTKVKVQSVNRVKLLRARELSMQD
jgi:hypothetical protein